MQSPTKHDNLSTWLHYMGGIHVSAIDMGLSRVKPVYDKLNINSPFVFMVAGTNGKGSVTATIDSICRQANLKTGLYQSPHLVSFNERIKIDGKLVCDEIFIEAFDLVERTRLDCQVSLSFFEMTTLAAFVAFDRMNLDIWVLEIGLGGRLDVVNIIEPNICVITNIAIDHTDWLGDDIEQIGFEKAGILRQRLALIYGHSQMPQSVQSQINALDVKCHQRGHAFEVIPTANGWCYSAYGITMNLPKSSLSVDNVATAVSAVLASGLNISSTAIKNGVKTVQLAGRFDRRDIRQRHWIFDVAHNKAGVEFLLGQLNWVDKPVHLMFSMLADKDIKGVLDAIKAHNLPIASWHIGTIDNVRAMSACHIAKQVEMIFDEDIHLYDSIAQAVDGVLACTKADELILCFGSFHTISEGLIALGEYTGFGRSADQ